MRKLFFTLFLLCSLPALAQTLGPPGGSGGGGGTSLPLSTPFTTTIPLTGNFYMPKQTISAATTFTPAANPVAGATTTVDLVGNGSITPNFSAFTEAGGSAGFNNASGIVNVVTFYYDGSSGVPMFQVTQPIPAQVPVAVTATSAQAGTAATNLTVTVNSTTLNTGITPAASAFSVADNNTAQTVSAVAVTASGVTLTLSPGAASTDTLTVSYTQPATNPVQDNNGNKLASFSALAVTNNISGGGGGGGTSPYGNTLQYSTANALTQATSATSGFYDYSSSYTGGGYSSNDGYGSSTKAIPASTDGLFGGVMKTGGADFLIGIKTSSANATYGSATAFVYVNGSAWAAGGTATLSGTPPAPAAGTAVRFRRTGTTCVFEYSTNSGSSWSTLATVTSTSVQLWGTLQMSNANTLQQAFGSASMQ